MQQNWFGLAFWALSASLLAAQNIPHAAIDSFVQRYRADNEHIAVSVSVCVDTLKQSQSYGAPASATFEIGSISKTLVTYLVAEQSEKGVLRLTDPVKKYLPKLPKRIGEITLLELCTHSSGLPDNPTDIEYAKEDPTEGYTRERFFRFLQQYKLDKSQKGKFLYSNTGFILLGYCLEAAANAPIQTQLAELLQRLSLPQANVLPMEQDKNLLIGYNEAGQKTPNWRFEAYLAAGGVHATGAAMADYLAHCLAMASANQLPMLWQTQFSSANQQTGLGWMKWKIREGVEGIWHNGGTTGFSSYLVFIPKMRVGVVVLANSGAGVDELATQILNAVLRANARM